MSVTHPPPRNSHVSFLGILQHPDLFLLLPPLPVASNPPLVLLVSLRNPFVPSLSRPPPFLSLLSPSSRRGRCTHARPNLWLTYRIVAGLLHSFDYTKKKQIYEPRVPFTPLSSCARCTRGPSSPPSLSLYVFVYRTFDQAAENRGSRWLGHVGKCPPVVLALAESVAEMGARTIVCRTISAEEKRRGAAIVM